jgi:hypothetical protein
VVGASKLTSRGAGGGAGSCPTPPPQVAGRRGGRGWATRHDDFPPGDRSLPARVGSGWPVRAVTERRAADRAAVCRPVHRFPPSARLGFWFGAGGARCLHRHVTTRPLRAQAPPTYAH